MDDELNELLDRLKALESRLAEKEKGWVQYFRFVEKLLLPVALGLLAWFGNQAANRISEGQLHLSESAIMDRKEEFRRTIQAKYAEMFYRDLNTGDANKLRNAMRLLNLIDGELAGQLSGLVEATPNVPADILTGAEKTRKEVEIFGPLFGFKVGIYFLRGNEESAAHANDIQLKLVGRGFSGPIQLYPSDKAFFELLREPKTLEVRYEPDRETPVADALIYVLKDLFPNLEFTKRPVVNRTASFISIFIPIGG